MNLENCGPKNFGSRKIWVQRSCVKQNFSLKKIKSKGICGTKNLGIKKQFGPKKLRKSDIKQHQVAAGIFKWHQNQVTLI